MGRLRTALPLGAAVATLACAPSAGAAVQGDYSVTGYAFPRSATTLVMAGTGSGGDGSRALWSAAIDHTPLSAEPGTVTGGKLALAAGSSFQTASVARADFGPGATALVSEAPGCGERVFSFTGPLQHVTIDGAPSATGAGSYALRMTVRRASLFGRCVGYARTVAGTFGFGA